jgi:hypothetical protein
MTKHPLPIYSSIELVSDKYADRGVPRGSRGDILEVYGHDAYEVQFFDAENNPTDGFAIEQSEARPIEDDPRSHRS